jgi:quercetin dioxygenase-like cupin family protein
MKLRAGGLNWMTSGNRVVRIMALPVLAFAILIGLIGPGEQALAGVPDGAPFASNPSNKVERAVLEDTANGKSAAFVVLMADQANLSAAYGMKDPDARGWYVYNTLKSQADKTQAGVRTAGEMKPKDVTDNVLGMIELGKEKVALADRRLRLRKLVVQPGGVVPWHSHEDRPALIYIVSGSIHEYASTCEVAIEHKAGEVSVEKLGVQHWWKNNSKSATVLLSADLFHDDKHDDEHVM